MTLEKLLYTVIPLRAMEVLPYVRSSYSTRRVGYGCAERC